MSAEVRGETAGREQCYRCFKPKSGCVCARITPVPNKVGVTVLQHPRERFHPLGTARFVELGLESSRVVPAMGGARPLLRPIDLPPGAGLLYPSADARDLATLPPSERPAHLVVLDGTWSHASSLYRENPWLSALPHFRLEPEQPSNYRLRLEPSEECLSTIESTVAALRILEPQTTGLDALLAAFDSMIDDQLAHVEARRGRPRIRKRRADRAFPGLPRALGEDFERLVFLYVEAGPRPEPRPLLHVVAERRRTGESFERLIDPGPSMPGECMLGFTGLTRAELSSGISPAALREALEGFLEPDDLLAAWNASTGDLLAARTGFRRTITLLKPAYRKSRSGGVGSLDDIVRREGLSPKRPPFRGRSASRLANARAVAELLHRDAQKPRQRP